MTPQEYLSEGAKIISEYLSSLGFRFKITNTGKGSGGDFATGQFIKKGFFNKSRIIELHFRYSLGLVSYTVGNLTLMHEELIEMYGSKGQNKYPGYSDNKLDAFHDLLYDLKHFLTDFTERNADLFKKNAPTTIKELDQKFQEESLRQEILYSGQMRLIQKARQEFKMGNYTMVEEIRKKLTYPESLSEAERKLFELNALRLQNSR